MSGGGFPSTASAVAMLACVALLVVASALALAPFDRPARRPRVVAFVGCPVAIRALAVLAVGLVGGTL